MTKILDEKNLENIKKVASVLKKGGIAIFPTDTVYGVGTDLNNPKAIEKLYKIIKRPENKPTAVLISSYLQLNKLVSDIPNSAKVLLEKFWPGSLSIVFEASPKIPKLITGGSDKIGIRMPGSQAVMDLINNLGSPIVTSSANVSGGKSPGLFSEVSKDLIEEVDVAIKGEVLLKKESTFIDITEEPFIILREGATSKEEIKEVIESEFKNK